MRDLAAHVELADAIGIMDFASFVAVLFLLRLLGLGRDRIAGDDNNRNEDQWSVHSEASLK